MTGRGPPAWRVEVGRTLADRLEALGLGAMVVRRGATVVHADDTALEILGRSLAELCALTDVSAVLTPEERYRRSEYRKRQEHDEGAPVVLRTVVLRPDGTTRPVELALLPMGDGELAAAIIRDISEDAERDQHLDWYASLVERMPVGVTIFDATDVSEPGRIRLWSANPAAAAATRRDLPGLIGRTVAEVFPDQRSSAEAARALELLDTGRVDHLPDLVVGDPATPDAVYRRTVVSLPGGALALLYGDITRERLDDLRHRQLAERIARVSDSERRSIAMGVHDDPIQQLAAAALLLARLRRRSEHDPTTGEWLERIETTVRKATESLRRLVFELIPPELVESGLAAAMRSAADHVFADTPVSVTVDCDLAEEPPHRVQTTAFRIAAEALSNARRHADARHVGVEIRIDGDMLHVRVADDGGGIRAGAEPGHVGIRGMHDRAVAAGGTLQIDGDAHGTAVTAVLPLDHDPRIPDGVDVSVGRTDAETESLRLERDSLREAEAAAIATSRMAWRRLRTITRLGTVLREAPLDRRARAHLAVREIADTFRDACAIRLIDRDGAVLRRIASWHDDPDQREYLDGWLFGDRAVDESHAALAFRSAQPLLLDRSRGAWRELDLPDRTGPFEPHTAIVAPLRVGATTRGVLSIVRDRTPERLAPTDVVYVAALADLVAGALAVDPITT